MESNENKNCGCGKKSASNGTSCSTKPSGGKTEASRPTSTSELTTTTTFAPKDDQRAAGGGKGPDRRQTVVDRRMGLDRRVKTAEASGYEGDERRSGEERRVDTGLERRRGPGRRRSDDRKSAEEGEMTEEQFEFCMAIETYKKVNKKMFPTWTEVLEVMRQLGYRKVEKRNIKLENVPEPKLHSKVA